MQEISRKLLSGHVPTLSIIFMLVSLVLVTIIPIGMLIYFRVKHKCSVKAFFLGCLVWIAFASVVEQIFHTLILGTPVGAKIQSNEILMGIYGGFMAALFEEGGKYLVMSTILKKDMNNDCDALMYGAGHGGAEAILILGATMLSNFMLSIMINTGSIGVTLSSLDILPADQALATAESFLQLIEVPSYVFIIGLFERIVAMACHIAMSIPVWFAVKNKKPALFFVAFGMHFMLDAVSGIMAGYVKSTIAVEAVIAAIGVIFVFISIKVYKKESKKPVE